MTTVAITSIDLDKEQLELARQLTGGLPRAAGAVDLLIAAYAIANDATVLSADRDFDSIALATGDRLRHEFVEVA